MRKRTLIAAAGIGVVLAATATGVAAATNGDDGSGSHQYTRKQADPATEAALAATLGGKVNSVGTDNENGATYEVEVTKTDGKTVDVHLYKAYQAVVIEGDSERGAT